MARKKRKNFSTVLGVLVVEGSALFAFIFLFVQARAERQQRSESERNRTPVIQESFQQLPDHNLLAYGKARQRH